MSEQEQGEWVARLAAVAFETAAAGPHDPSTWHAVAEAVEAEVVKAITAHFAACQGTCLAYANHHAAFTYGNVLADLRGGGWKAVPRE